MDPVWWKYLYLHMGFNKYIWWQNIWSTMCRVNSRPSSPRFSIHLEELLYSVNSINMIKNVKKKQKILKIMNTDPKHVPRRTLKNAEHILRTAEERGTRFESTSLMVDKRWFTFLEYIFDTLRADMRSRSTICSWRAKNRSWTPTWSTFCAQRHKELPWQTFYAKNEVQCSEKIGERGYSVPGPNLDLPGPKSANTV